MIPTSEVVDALPDALADPASHDAALWQLRYQTKNALQRILWQISDARELQGTTQGQLLVSDLERRVRLSSMISDALFGIVSRPGSLDGRLRTLSESTADLLGDPDQLVRVEVSVGAGVVPELDDTILRIGQEFVSNAVKHGLYRRSVGAIGVSVELQRGAVLVQVTDDGWGFRCEPHHGEGLQLAALLAGQHRGAVALVRRRGVTVAEALLHPA